MKTLKTSKFIFWVKIEKLVKHKKIRKLKGIREMIFFLAVENYYDRSNFRKCWLVEAEFILFAILMNLKRKMYPTWFNFFFFSNQQPFYSHWKTTFFNILTNFFEMFFNTKEKRWFMCHTVFVRIYCLKILEFV